MGSAVTYWDKQIGHLLFVLGPGVSILPTAPCNVPSSTVDDHDHEEDKVKPRERAPEPFVSNNVLNLWDMRTIKLGCRQRRDNLLEPSDETPRHGEEHVRHIVGLAYDGEPSVQQYPVSSFCLENARILDDCPGHMRECLALNELTALLLTERVLLAVGRIPHPIHEKVNNGENC